jgi:hypothetical protein
MRLTPVVLVFIQLTLLAQSRVPAPQSVFGFAPGTDYKLASYDQLVDYFKRVDAASDRVKVFEAGQTSQGRTFYFALISSKGNLSKIDRYRQIAWRLAHPETLSESEAQNLAREGKAFVHIDGGLHSNELAGPQHTAKLLETLVRGADTPEIAAILDDVVLMLWPTINPDGQQLMSEWYMKHVSSTEGLKPLPVLYQDYVGHDNNRDAYMLNMIESRVMEHTWRQWEPQIIYVHHQSAPFPTRIWLPPFAEPIAPHAPYLMSRQVNMIGMAIAMELEERGQVGATHMGTGYDAWYPGYIDYAPMFKNIAAFWTETAGGQGPRESTLEDFPAPMRDLRPQSLYASPWAPGTWRMRDQVAYMETASLAVLEFASKYKTSLLFNRYKAGVQQIEKGRVSSPFAYFIPQEQRDPVAAVELLRRLAFGGVRVSQLPAPALVDGEMLPAGTWAIPADQEFAALAREVLDVQKYPDLRESPDGALDQPYDAAGWTLPFAMGLRVIAAKNPLPAELRSALRANITPAVFTARIAPYPGLGARPSTMLRTTPSLSKGRDSGLALDSGASFDSVPGIGFDSHPAAARIVPPAGRVSGSGSVLALDPAQNNTFRAINRALAAGLDVQFSEAGPRYLLGGLSQQDQNSLIESLALVAERTDAVGRSLRGPRIGVFSAPASMDAGWTRWVLEQYGFQYRPISGADLETGELRKNVDVLIVTDESRGVVGPAATSDNVTRVRHLDEFVRAGGTLICINSSTQFAIEYLKLPVRNALAGLRRQDFFAGGSLLQVIADTAHPVMAGMPASAAVFVQGSPAFETLEGFQGSVLARYADAGSPLLSGYLLGEQYLQGKAAAVDVACGAGHVVLIGFRPAWRGQTFGTFRVLFNAALYTTPNS